MKETGKTLLDLQSGSDWKRRGKDGALAGPTSGWDRRKAAPVVENRAEFTEFLCVEKSVFAARMRIPAICLLALLPLAGCGPKAPVAADQPVPVRVRVPNRVQQPVSVAVS